MDKLLYQLDNVNKVKPFFSPSSFLIFLDTQWINQFSISQRTNFAKFSQEDLLKILKNDFQNLSPNEEEQFLILYASFVHEVKHFWDHIGTTYGLSRFTLFLKRHFTAKKLINLLKPDESCLPLLKYGKWKDYKKAIHLKKEFSSQHFEECILDDVGTIFQESDFLRSDIHKTSFRGNIVVKNNILPSYVARVLDDKDKIWFLHVPLGGRTLVESAAMTVELDLLANTFGYNIAAERKRHFTHWDPQDPKGVYYGACDLYLSNFIPNFYYNHLLMLCDLALLGDLDGTNYDSFHPGWRFEKLTTIVSEVGFPKNSYEDWYCSIFKRMNITPLQHFLDRILEHISQILQNIDSFDSSLTKTISMVYEMSKKVFKARQIDPLAIASPKHMGTALLHILGFSNLENSNTCTAPLLPSPIIVQSDDCGVISYGNNVDIDGVKGLVRLSIDSNIIFDALMSERIVCPLLKFNFNCPQATKGCGVVPLRLKDYNHPSCSFREAVDGMGLLKIQTKRKDS